jgi:exodeoxyribonuclease V alpha subunit
MKKEKHSGDYTFRELDKIMQIKNDYDMPWSNIEDNEDGIGLFNGDIGLIKNISNEFDNMDIVFDDVKKANYPFASLSNLELAYATTIHKSQGSEFPAIIIPLYPSSTSLLSRNLLYTAITRAKKLVILVGQQSVLNTMINNNKEVLRCSGLKERLMYN